MVNIIRLNQNRNVIRLEQPRKNIISMFRGGLEKLKTLRETKQLQTGFVPMGGAGGKVISTIGQGLSKLGQMFQRTLPSAQTGVKTGLKTFGKQILSRAGIIASTYGAFQLARAGQSGKFDVMPNVLTTAGLALNPFAGALGLVFGAGEKQFPKVLTLGQTWIGGKKFPQDFNIPDIPPSPPPPPPYQPPDTKIIIEQAPITITQAPTGQLPSYSPSLSISGGGGFSPQTDLSTLLLLLAGTGGLGYFLGRKKKKKKYKKRKKH